MKRFILAAAVTMLALAGAAAAAQDHSGSPVYGVEPPQTSAGYLGAAATPRAMAPALDSKQRAKLTTALHGYQMSCQPDRETLCADKHYGFLMPVKYCRYPDLRSSDRNPREIAP